MDSNSYTPFSELYPQCVEFDQVTEDVAKTSVESECITCGKQTVFVEFNFGAHYCSPLCVKVEDFSYYLSAMGAYDESSTFGRKWRKEIRRISTTRNFDPEKVRAEIEEEYTRLSEPYSQAEPSHGVV